MGKELFEAKDVVNICATFIAGLLGISVPLIVQVLSNIDQKYNSTHLLKIIKQEPIIKWFTISLIFSILSLCVFFCDFSTPKNLPKLSNTNLYFVELTTLCLIVIFFILIRKVILYSSPDELVTYLIEKQNNTDISNDNDYFKALGDILMFCIEKQNEQLGQTISNSFYKIFEKERKKNEERGYPDDFYFLIRNIIIHSVGIKNNKLQFLISRSIGGIWLFGEYIQHKVSERTYIFQWQYIRLAINNERDDMVLSYWSHANQFIFSNYESFDYYDETEENKSERERFLEFHYALGGLVLFSNRFSLLNSLFNYSETYPPVYKLLPKSIGDIYRWFIYFKDPYLRNSPFFFAKYSLIDNNNLGEEETTKQWIFKYLAVLFLRQYTQPFEYVNQNPMDVGNIPQNQIDRKLWINNINHFKEIVNQVYTDITLKQNLKLDFVNDTWCIEHKMPKPEDVLENLKNQLQTIYDKIKINTRLSEVKILEFKNSTKLILEETVDKYQIISSKNFGSKFKSKKYYIGGGFKTNFDKDAFIEESESTWLDIDSIMAKQLSNGINQGISEIFFRLRTESYLIEKGDLIDAIEKLKIGNKESFLVVSFGNDRFFNDLIVKNSLASIKYLNLPNGNYNLVGDSIFILNTNDLPQINFIDIDSKIKEKYKFDKSDLLKDSYKIYAKILPLNENPAILEEERVNYPNESLETSVLAYIFLYMETIWKEQMRMVQFYVRNPYDEKGLPNSLDDIQPL